MSDATGLDIQADRLEALLRGARPLGAPILATLRSAAADLTQAASQPGGPARRGRPTSDAAMEDRHADEEWVLEDRHAEEEVSLWDRHCEELAGVPVRDDGRRRAVEDRQRGERREMRGGHAGERAALGRRQRAERGAA